MRTSNQDKPQNIKRKYVAFGVGIALVVCFAIYFHSWAKDYAYDAAAPIEAVLLHNGARKVCTESGDGRYSATGEPSYRAVYETGLTKDRAEAVIYMAAHDNGYKLTHADSPYEYIEWYSDTDSMESAYSALKKGKVQLHMDLYSDGNSLSCLSGVRAKYDSANVAMSLQIGLPARR